MDINLSETMAISKAMALGESMLPEEIRKKTGDDRVGEIFIRVLAGKELGLSPFQSLSAIAVINGKPSVWGRYAWGIVQSSKQYEWAKEEESGSIEKEDYTYTVTIKRKGDEHPYTASFSWEDAKRANLVGKIGSWKFYPKEMIQWKARSRASIKFSDELCGLYFSEDIEGDNIVNVTPKKTVVPILGEVNEEEERRKDYIQKAQDFINSKSAEEIKKMESRLIARAEASGDDVVIDTIKSLILEKING